MTASEAKLSAFDPDALPVGLVRLDSGGLIVEANALFRAWAESDSPLGRPLSDFAVPVDDFLESATTRGMMARPDRPERAAFLIPADDGQTFTLVESSERYAAGRALRAARTRADRTQTRLQLIIDSSIEFAKGRSETDLANILSSTASAAYRAEEAAVYLTDDHGVMTRAAGSNPFEELADLGATEGTFALNDVLMIAGREQAAAISDRLERMMRASGVQSILAAPLHLDHAIVGVFACFFHHPRQFDEEAAPLAEALAGQAAQALTSLRLQKRLEYAASHDETTGLPNRRRLESEIEALGQDKDVAVMFVDLDGFKAVNDYLGHQFGDEVLREVATRLRETVREGDLVVRYGGDEFVVVCEVTDAVLQAGLADRVRHALQLPYHGLPADLAISASVGVATGTASVAPLTVDRLIRVADQAMYEAKLGGGDRVVNA